MLESYCMKPNKEVKSPMFIPFTYWMVKDGILMLSRIRPE